MFLLAFGTAQAQHVLGVVWDIPANESQAVQELKRFQALGITVLQLQQLPSGRIWSEINGRDFSVYGDLGIRFPTTYTFESPDSLFISRIQKRIAGFTTHSSVKALNLFSYGAVHQDAFNNASISFFNRFDSLRSVRTYYTGNRESTHSGLSADFLIYDMRPAPQYIQTPQIPVSPTIGGYRYTPPPNLEELLTPLQQIVRGMTEQPRALIFLEDAWLLSMVDRHPQFKATLQSLSSDSEPVFPAPSELQPSQSQSPLPIIVLLVVWAILAFHYNTSPLYRKSLFRYFTGHRFFLSDILRQHIRSPFPAVFIIFQHALLSGAVLFAAVNSFFSWMGMQSLQYHLPGLFFISGGEYDIFIMGGGAILVFSLISILWLYFSHKSLRSINQMMIMYAWPLQVNILFGTVAIAFYVSSEHPKVIAVLAGLMLAVWLGSFIMAARDAAQHLTRKRLKYISLTAGIYLIVLAGIAIWLLEFNDPLWQVIDLGMALK